MAKLNKVIDTFNTLAIRAEKASNMLEQTVNKDIIGQRNDMRDLSVLIREIAENCLTINIAITNFMFESWEELKSVNNNETEKA